MYKIIKEIFETTRVGITALDVACALKYSLEFFYSHKIIEQLTDEQEEEIFKKCMSYAGSIITDYTQNMLMTKITELVGKCINEQDDDGKTK